MPLHYAIFGGSFNPIHQGHVAVVEQLLEQELDQIVIMPTSRSPYKLQQPLLPNPLRLEMIQQTFQNRERVKICEFEIKRRHVQYTYDTLKHLQKQHPDVIWHLVLGWDTFQEFAQWKNAREILTLASLWVVNRAGSPDLSNSIPAPFVIAPFTRWFEGINWFPSKRTAYYQGREMVRYLEFDTPSISSTKIRSGQAGLEWLPPMARHVYVDFFKKMQKKSN